MSTEVIHFATRRVIRTNAELNEHLGNVYRNICTQIGQLSSMHDAIEPEKPAVVARPRKRRLR